FCCLGCKTVYELFSENGLNHYYDLQKAAGASPNPTVGKYDFLDSQEIVSQLIDFEDNSAQVASLYIPHIHCSSCIWVLENLNRLHKGIISSHVDFTKKKLTVTYTSNKISLKELAVLLAHIGYEPYISLQDYDEKSPRTNRSLLYKLGVAGFSFGNVMLLSFPEYFEVNEFWLDRFKHTFRWIMFFFSLPVVLYAAQDYFISAYKGLRSNLLNIDVPIALGISVLFIRSTVEIVLDIGQGFFDSLTGLVFFLLLGKFFQQKTYSYLSFERDYKSYFPIAVTRITQDGNEKTVQVYDIKKGDHLLIRNMEIIPVDGVLTKGNAQIDYSFVTGESDPVHKKKGDTLFAGGKQVNGAIELIASKKVSQSYLTQLWGHAVFKENKASKFQTMTDGIGKRFTLAVLTIAALATIYWLYREPSMALNVLTAVLIIACPCAIALSAPFALGNMLRIFGKLKFYVKDTLTLEQMAASDTVIFDKTGTLTSSRKVTAHYEGIPLTKAEESLLKSSLRASNHPLSRSLYKLLAEHNIVTLDTYQEELGKGIRATHANDTITIGSAQYVGANEPLVDNGTSVHISTNNDYRGHYAFKTHYRNGIRPLFSKMGQSLQMAVLSGDNAKDRQDLKQWLPPGTPLLFNQKPEDKLNFVKDLQQKGAQVLMVGDGLNDAGALAQSHVGIAISEDVNVFSPACDAILDADRLSFLYDFITASKKAVSIVKISFFLSLLYNLVGLYFAVTGQLEPVIAAILMPLSSISIIIFTTVMTNWVGHGLKGLFSRNAPRT
ncbi:MAG: heavy metal translocating P-type ATPase metal-binding domain-containing protein, partial [Flavobacteriaceae bacterium]